MQNLSSLNSSSKVTVCLSLAVLHQIWLWGSFLPRMDGLKTQFFPVAATLGQTPAAPHALTQFPSLDLPVGVFCECSLPMKSEVGWLIWWRLWHGLSLGTAHFPNADKGVLTLKACLAELCVLLIISRERAMKIWDWSGASLLHRDKGASTYSAKLPLTSSRNMIL